MESESIKFLFKVIFSSHKCQSPGRPDRTTHLLSGEWKLQFVRLQAIRATDMHRVNTPRSNTFVRTRILFRFGACKSVKKCPAA